MKIENKPALATDRSEFRDFVTALRDMQSGQSILVDAVPANYRAAISVAQIIRGVEIASRKEGGKVRVGVV